MERNMTDLPLVELLDNTVSEGHEDANEMCENRFPHTELEFMHKVDDKHSEEIECDPGNVLGKL